MHPTVIISAYRQALEDMQDILRDQVRSAAAALYHREYVYILYIYLHELVQMVELKFAISHNIANLLNLNSVYDEILRDCIDDLV